MTRKFATFLCGGLLGAALFIPLSITAQDKPAAKPAAKPAGDCGGCCEGEGEAKTAKPAPVMPVGDGCCGDETKVAGDGGMNTGTPDQQAMMAAFEAAAKPGDNHRKLDALVGTWSTKSIYFCDPTKTQETTGVSVVTWSLGGRFIEERMFGSMPGTNLPFEGMSITGYDNVAGKFVGTWVDNQSTAIMPMQGAFEGKTLTMRGECNSAAGIMKFRMVLEIQSADRHQCTMFMAMGDQPEAKAMEMVYTRK